MSPYRHWTDTVYAFTWRTGACVNAAVLFCRENVANHTDRHAACVSSCWLVHTDCTHTRTHTHTNTQAHSDDKRGHCTCRAVIYTVSIPSGHDECFQKHKNRCWLRTYSTYMCSPCKNLTCFFCFPLKKIDSQVRYTVIYQVCVGVWGGTLLIASPCLPVCCSLVIHKHRCVTRPSL